jgi:hypothetical protein
MNPYEQLPTQSFWKAVIHATPPHAVQFDCGKKFTFPPTAAFVTAGSCFAQHFAKKLAERGGNVLIAEQRHPLTAENSAHGYNIFSARYGNIYTTRQLLEILQQAFAIRPTIYDFGTRDDGRWVDMLRPRAVPMGFSSEEQGRADRDFHLAMVRKLISEMDVLVFTLGLTETWVNSEQNYCYPVVPGAIAGEFIESKHTFKNLNFNEVTEDLRAILQIIASHNIDTKVILTVSPVGLVATVEQRNVLVSTSASKSILRAAADEIVREFTHVDYFPSFEIITSPYTQGNFWAEGLRDVTEKGVDCVMGIFFDSRMPDFHQQTISPQQPTIINPSIENALEKAITEECDEMFLDPSLRSRKRDQ